MGVALGVILVLAGAIIYWALNLNLDFVNDETLGIILMVVGVLAIVLSLIMNAQRNRTKHIEERRID
jgi:uncharacterized membrane protein HdeD (DUF308 family)